MQSRVIKDGQGTQQVGKKEALADAVCNSNGTRQPRNVMTLDDIYVDQNSQWDLAMMGKTNYEKAINGLARMEARPFRTREYFNILADKVDTDNMRLLDAYHNGWFDLFSEVVGGFVYFYEGLEFTYEDGVYFPESFKPHNENAYRVDDDFTDYYHKLEEFPDDIVKYLTDDRIYELEIRVQLSSKLMPMGFHKSTIDRKEVFYIGPYEGNQQCFGIRKK